MDQAPNHVLGAPEALREQAEAAQKFAEAQHAPATRRAYAADFPVFEDWCRLHGLKALPALPATVATFLAFEARRGTKVSTITRRTAAIRYAHAAAGLEAPTNSEVVRATLRGIRRSLGIASTRKAPATAERVLDMVRTIREDPAGLRDRALLLLGFAGAFRRSELAALNVADLEFRPEGLRVTIRRSKTDQEGASQVVAIVRGQKACPVAAVETWLACSNGRRGGAPDPSKFHRYDRYCVRRSVLGLLKPGRLIRSALAYVRGPLPELRTRRSKHLMGALPPISGPQLRRSLLSFASDR